MVVAMMEGGGRVNYGVTRRWLFSRPPPRCSRVPRPAPPPPQQHPHTPTPTQHPQNPLTQGVHDPPQGPHDAGDGSGHGVGQAQHQLHGQHVGQVLLRYRAVQAQGGAVQVGGHGRQHSSSRWEHGEGRGAGGPAACRSAPASHLLPASIESVGRLCSPQIHPSPTHQRVLVGALRAVELHGRLIGTLGNHCRVLDAAVPPR